MKVRVDFDAQPTYSNEYLKLHRKFNVPLHDLTPEQTRFFHYAFRNEINLFWRTCDKTGEKIISQFPQSAPFKVFRHDLWWKDDFEVAESLYDSQTSFFQQFRDLQLQVPRMSVACDTTQENCPYVNCSNHSKDCHMVFATGDCEDCLYCINSERCVSTMDATITHDCELCYEITSCRKCYNLNFSAQCADCSDSFFLFGCRRCRDCFLCAGLVGKQYCFANKQLSTEEYFKKIEEIFPLSHEKIDNYWEQLSELSQKIPHKFSNQIGSEESTGEEIGFSQRCRNSYITEYSQDCLNCSSLRKCKDCLDFDLWGDPGELCYNSMSCGYNVYMLRMCFDCWNNCRFLTYCDSCPGCEHCFGCVGLKRKKFCILNKQFSEKEYHKKMKEIIVDMTQREECGQFFPPYCSPHALNNSMAHEYFYTDKSLAKNLGFEWMEKSEEKGEQKPLKGVFICQKSKLPYKIEKRELKLLQEKQLPIPRYHWKIRMGERTGKFLRPWKLFGRTCEKCSAPMRTSFAPERSERVYCEKCFREEVN